MTGKNDSGSRIVTGVFSDSGVASNALATLINAGFERRSLSVVGADTDQFREITAQVTKKGPDVVVLYCSAVGALFGAACGWYAIEAMPAAKYFLSVVPLLAALCAAAAGAYIGLLAGGLLRFDTPTYECNVRTKAVKKGFLISVSVKDSTSRFRAENILEKCAADKIVVAHPEEEPSTSST